MSDDLDFEDELLRLLAESGDDLLDSMSSEESSSTPEPVLTAAAPSKERVLSQAEIDALLASMGGD